MRWAVGFQRDWPSFEPASKVRFSSPHRPEFYTNLATMNQYTLHGAEFSIKGKSRLLERGALIGVLALWVLSLAPAGALN